MLGRRKRQRGLFTAPTMLEESDLDRMGFYAKLAKHGDRIFEDDDFASMYCEDNGRPSVPPSLLALVSLLQFRDGLSDRKVIDRLRFDLRWKVALRQDPLSTETPFSRTTLQVFRSRLSLHEKEGAAFERSIAVAKDVGLLPKRLRLAVDSTPVRGRGAVKDTFNLLSDAISSVVRKVAKSQGEAPVELAREVGLGRHLEASSVKGSEEVDWQDPASVAGFLTRLLEDARAAVRLARERDAAGEEVELLERIVRQDIDEVDEEGGPPSIRRGVAKERVVSVTDPEIRTRHHSKSNKTTGHKAHAVVDIETGIVTALDVTSPSTSEGSKVADLIRESQRTTGAEVDEVLGDCAYSSRAAAEGAKTHGVQLRTRMPRGPKGRFGPGDFEVSADLETAICPAGHAAVKRGRSGANYVHHWAEELCGSCALRARCTKAKLRRLVTPPDFHDRRESERWAWSSAGRRALRDRMPIEHAFGRLKGRGAGKARFFGQAKTRLQWLWTTAAANLSLAWAYEAAAA